MDGEGDVDDGRNVIRLPRDWIGPYEELVPVGSRADREDAERNGGPAPGATNSDDDDFAEIPGPDSFWTEGATALHHPIQAASAPPPRADGHRSPPRRRRIGAVGLGVVRPRVRARLGPPGWPTARGLGHRSRRSIVLVASVAIVLVIVVAVVGVSEGPSRPALAMHPHVTVGHAASGPQSHAGTTGTALARAPTRSLPEPRSIARTPLRRHAPRRARRGERLDRRGTRDGSATSHAVVTTTVTTQAPPAAPATPVDTTPATTVTEPQAAAAGYQASSGSSSGTSQGSRASSSTGPAGPTGVGSAQNCDPKCS